MFVYLKNTTSTHECNRRINEKYVRSCKPVFIILNGNGNVRYYSGEEEKGSLLFIESKNHWHQSEGRNRSNGKPVFWPSFRLVKPGYLQNNIWKKVNLVFMSVISPFRREFQLRQHLGYISFFLKRVSQQLLSEFRAY